MTIEPSVLSEAIVVWVGWGGPDPLPKTDDSRVVSRYGEAVSLEILPMIRQLHNDFYATDAIDRVADHGEMLDVAAVEFRARHPEISADAVDALKWCMSWDYR